jgi:hypothetical protein
MHQPSIIFRREVYEEFGPFDTSLHYAMDFDFFLRASSKYDLHHMPVDLGLFREYSNTKTGDGAAEAFLEARRCLVRYVRESGTGSPSLVALRGFFAQGCVWVNDAVAHYENGRPRQARRDLVRGFFRNPMSLFLRRHQLFRLRQLLGPSRYNTIRRWYRDRP